MGFKDLFGKKNNVDLKTLKMGKEKDDDLTINQDSDSKFDPATSWDDISTNDFEDEKATSVYDFEEVGNKIDLKTEDIYSEKNFEDTLNNLYLEEGVVKEEVKDFGELKDLYKENGVSFESLAEEEIKSEISKDVEQQFGDNFVPFDDGLSKKEDNEFGDNFTLFEDVIKDSKTNTGVVEENFDDISKEKELMELYQAEEEKNFSSNDLLKENFQEKNKNAFEKPSSQSNEMYCEVEESNGLKKIAASIMSIFRKKGNESIDFSDLDETKTSEFGDSDFIYQEKFVQKKIPLFSYLEVKTQYKLIISTFVIGATMTAASLILAQIGETREGAAALTTSRIWGDNLGYSQSFTSVGKTGEGEKIAKMKNSFSNMEKEKIKLTNELSALGNAELIEADSRLNKIFANLKSNVEGVLKLTEIAKSLEAKRLVLDRGVEEMSNFIDRLIFVGYQVGSNQSEISTMLQLKSSIQSIHTQLSSIILEDSMNPQAVAKLQSSKKDIKESLTDLLNGSEIKGIRPLNGEASLQAYNKIVSSWLELSKGVDEVLASPDEIALLKKTLAKNGVDVAALNAELSRINAKFNYKNYAYYDLIIIASILGMIIMLISGITLLILYSFEKDNKNEVDRIENNKNRTAILQLLNEMLPLQDGDLRKPVTVTEEVTGAIAESVNATIESLALIVRKIKETTLVMREKSSEMSLVSLEMLNSTEEQADSITKTGLSVIDITGAINDISIRTKKTAQIAETSAKSSKIGEDQVVASLDSMQLIDQNMEETVLLMKKVGDSSKQISEIVELLSDISEQTNILALNATVQAAKAGEAGKGFKIVADSIQELADTASEATRRVGALISAVQTDIQSVTFAVDKTKEEVTKGVSLSENAGKTLNEINKISQELAETVKEISEEANKNAIIARGVSKSMEKILESTEKAKESTEKTTESITEIAGMSSELGESVQKFQL